MSNWKVQDCEGRYNEHKLLKTVNREMTPVSTSKLTFDEDQNFLKVIRKSSFWMESKKRYKACSYVCKLNSHSIIWKNKLKQGSFISTPRCGSEMLQEVQRTVIACLNMHRGEINEVVVHDQARTII